MVMRKCSVLVSGTSVVDTILWDGPASFEDYRARWREHVVNAALEGTIRCAVLKRGRAVDEWYLGRVRENASITGR